MNIRRIDSSQYVNRLMSRDYDMIVTGYPVTTSPGANCSTTSARSGHDPGSNNYMVLKNPAVDT
jgi:microcin C transport system substrate-binding protein